jgi:hypothetical protein
MKYGKIAAALLYINITDECTHVLTERPMIIKVGRIL